MEELCMSMMIQTLATCYATPFSYKTTIYSECFIQGISLYKKSVLNAVKYGNVLNIYFNANNSATVAGDVLYGGLLDRCGVSPFAEIFLMYTHSTPSSLSAISYMLNITDLEIQDFNSTKMISSDPVRVCFCRDNQSDCSYHPQPESVRKGETFTVSLVAVRPYQQHNSTQHDTCLCSNRFCNKVSSVKDNLFNRLVEMVVVQIWPTAFSLPHNSEKLASLC